MEKSFGNSSSTLNPTAPESNTQVVSPPTETHLQRGQWQLPDEPLVVIGPSGTGTPFNLRELWAYREVLYSLTRRDIKVRYKQTALGAAWAILQPLFMMVIFSLFFGRLAGIPSDNIPYPLFAYAGLLPWTFFSNALTNSGNSLVGSANLITKVYFPRMIVPGASVAAGILDLLIAFAILVVLMLYYRVGISWNILLLPVFVALTTLLAFSVGMWLSALNVKYRDIRFALPFFIQLGMFISPVIYPTSFVPERFRWLFELNPMTGIIEGYRSSLFGQPFNWRAIGIATLITLVHLRYSLYTFRRMEKSFADII